MSQNKFAFARYRIIDNLLRRKTYVKTSEMVESCFERTGFCVSKRTIQLDIESMKYDDFLGFYAPIEYNTRLKAYYYETAPHPLYVAPRFTPEEIRNVKQIFELCSDRLSPRYCLLFRELIRKMEE